MRFFDSGKRQLRLGYAPFSVLGTLVASARRLAFRYSRVRSARGEYSLPARRRISAARRSALKIAVVTTYDNKHTLV